jgi:hypothetical protein
MAEAVMPTAANNRIGPTAETLGQAAGLGDMPYVVERLLYLLDERDRRVEQQRKAHGSEYADVHVLDELDDLVADLLPLVAERREEFSQHRLYLVVNAEGL